MNSRKQNLAYGDTNFNFGGTTPVQGGADIQDDDPKNIPDQVILDQQLHFLNAELEEPPTTSLLCQELATMHHRQIISSKSTNTNSDKPAT